MRIQENHEHLVKGMGVCSWDVCVCGQGVPPHDLKSYNWMLDEGLGSVVSWLHLRCSQVSWLAL